MDMEHSVRTQNTGGHKNNPKKDSKTGVAGAGDKPRRLVKTKVESISSSGGGKLNGESDRKIKAQTLTVHAARQKLLSKKNSRPSEEAE